MEFTTRLLEFYWPLLFLTDIVIAVVAHHRYRHTATVLLLLAAILRIIRHLISVFAVEVEVLLTANLNGTAAIISVLSRVLFLAGLLLLVNHVASLKTISRHRLTAISGHGK